MILITISVILYMTISVMVVTNCYILYLPSRSTDVRKSYAKSVSRRTVLTVSLICFIFVTSWLPLGVSKIVLLFGGRVSRWVEIFQVEFLSANIVLNPLIFWVTNRRFRRFFSEIVIVKKKKTSILKSSVSIRNKNAF